jgi:subtilisin family serine protease
MAFQGMRWAMEHGANVISMSLGFDFPGMVRDLTAQQWPADLATSSALEAYRGNLRMFDALMGMIRANQAFAAGTVVVAAAGNESRRDKNADYEIAASLPAAAEGVVSVAAASREGDALGIGYFSNTFPQITGPGVDITSARAGGGLAQMTGTSMACPHVAGVAALWWEAIRAAGLPVRAETVVAKLLASARTDVFAADVDPADRGVGLVTAP